MHQALAILLAFVVIIGVAAKEQDKNVNGNDSPKTASNCTCSSGNDAKLKALADVVENLQKRIKQLEKRDSQKKTSDILLYLLRHKRLRSLLMKRNRKARGFFDENFDPVKLFFGESLEGFKIFTQAPPTKPPATFPDLLGGVKDNAPQLNKDGKVPQNLLPAGFNKHSAYDIQWQALHMSAASACRSVSNKMSFPGLHSIVLLRNAAQMKSCRNLCAGSWARNCQGEVSLWGKVGKGTKNGEEIANYQNYGCDYGFNGGSEAYAKDEEVGRKFHSGHGNMYSFCCCSFY